MNFAGSIQAQPTFANALLHTHHEVEEIEKGDCSPAKSNPQDVFHEESIYLRMDTAMALDDFEFGLITLLLCSLPLAFFAPIFYLFCMPIAAALIFIADVWRNIILAYHGCYGPI